VSPNQVYESSEIAVYSNTVYAGACNQPNHTYDIYKSTGFGSNTFQIAWQIPNVDCAFSDLVTRSTFNVFGNNHAYVFYGMNAGGGQQYLFINRGNGAEHIDTDVERPLNSVNEVYNPTHIGETGYIVTPYYNRSENAVKVSGSRIGSLDPIVVQDVGPAPNFTTFFGIGCQEAPPGVANIIYPGGNHVQIDTLTKTTTLVDANGNFENPNGPLGLSSFISSFNTEAKPGFVDLNNPVDHVIAMYLLESIGCGVFILPSPNPIPTLSQWGLIAMAAILGIVGFMVIRRKKATA
jgi:hypothetical protein